ncbi:phloretin 2'-O-glucosyltransferase [Selaginella moellendorffii]|nr:phloretin 2'-O-glucosyltransferase [Selaginella moellendorffii]|eukprot:XP_024532366.1 phloretin 2'-O-glucosyltransferase [Selaginella moellendorffii]
MPATDLPLAFYYDHPILGVICDGASRFAEARFALCNTYEELEPHAVATLRSEMKSSYFPVGPCLSPAFFAGDSTAVERSSEHLSPEDLACLEWLDTQKESSVIYVSFGSMATLSMEQLQELARGLERSNQPFVLVLRKTLVADPSVHDFFEGLKQRIGERGIVISWAPQMHVLLHPAVGGFLTHCGWNSTVEGICAGVPMLAWPCMAEQNINCKELVEHWKLAIPVQDDRDKNSVVSSERLADLVARLMRGDEGREMRARAREFRKVAAAAVAEGGSSDRNLKAFAQALRDLEANN